MPPKICGPSQQVPVSFVSQITYQRYVWGQGSQLDVAVAQGAASVLQSFRTAT